MDWWNGTIGEKVWAIIDSRAGGNAGIFMVVDSDSWYYKVLAIEYSAGCKTASIVRSSGLATVRIDTRFRVWWMAMIHLTAFKTTFTTITAAGKRMGYEQTNAKNQN